MKKTMKKTFALLLAFVMLFSLAACGGGEVEQGTTDQTYELKFANQDAEGLPTTNAMYWIAQEVEKRTDGHVKIKVYPANQLGESSVLLQGIMDGSIDMVETFVDGTYDNIFNTASIPFLVRDLDSCRYLFDPQSNLYQLFEEAMEKLDMKFMGFYLNGCDGVFAKGDLGNYLDPTEKKTMLCRIANSETYKMGIEALGYPTVTIPWTDTYTSMQTGVFKAMTGIPPYMVAQNFGDITDVYLPIDIFTEIVCIMVSPITWEKLPTEYQDILAQVILEAEMNSLDETADNQEDGLRQLRDLGVEILPITDEQKASIADYVSEQIQDKLVNLFGQDVMDLINEDIENAAK